MIQPELHSPVPCPPCPSAAKKIAEFLLQSVYQKCLVLKLSVCSSPSLMLSKESQDERVKEKAGDAQVEIAAGQLACADPLTGETALSVRETSCSSMN